MNEIVKYDNRMNLLKFKGFTKVDMNILMVLCTKMKDKDIEEITLSFEQIKELSKFTSTNKKDFIEALKGMIERLQKVNSKVITNNEICYFVLFPTFKVNPIDEIVKIGVNKDFTFLLNDLKAFTRFELAEFIELDSKYTKNLYRLLKQFRTTGKLVIDNIEDFREKLDSPKSYKTKDFKRFVLDVAIEELQEKEYFKNLKVEVKKAKKRGSPVIGYIFTFEPEKPNKKPQNGQAEPKLSDGNTQPKQPIRTSKPKTTNRFNQFPQREYTQEAMSELEKMLLQKK